MAGEPYKRPENESGKSADVVEMSDFGRQYQPPPNAASKEPAFGGGDDPPPPRRPTATERKFAARKRNEQVKLFASGLSSLAFGLVSISFVQPILKDAVLLVKEPHWGWWATATGLHLFAHFILRTELVRED